MLFLRIAAVLTCLVAAPLLMISAENLAERSREAYRTADRDRVAKDRTDRVRLAAATVQTDVGPSGPSAAPPMLTRILIESRGAASFQGLAAPGSEVTLSVDGAAVGRAVADQSGVWRLTLERPLQAGDHRVALSSMSADRSGPIAGGEARISIPDALTGRAVVAYEAATGSLRPAGEPVRRQAEELAAAASERFSQLVPRQTAAPDPESKPPEGRQSPSRDGWDAGAMAAPVLEWLERSAETYQSTIIKGLSTNDLGAPAASTPAAPPSPALPLIGNALADVQLAAQEWLALANRTYQTEIIRKLEAPAASVAAAPAPVAPSSKGPQPGAPRAVSGEEAGAKAPSSAKEEAARAEAARRAAAAARAEEQARADEMKRAEEAKRLAQAASEPPRDPAKPAGQPNSAAPAAADRAEAISAKADMAKSEAAKADAAKLEAARKAAEDAAKRARLADEAQKAEAAASKLKAADAKRQQDEAERKRTEEARNKAVADAALKRESEAKRLAAEKSAQEAQKAAERQRADEAQKAEAAAKRTEAAEKAAARAKASESNKAAERPRDARIAEGSGEKGPVERPATPRRGEIDRSTRSGLGVGAPAAAGAAAAAAKVKSAPPAPAARGRVCDRAGERVSTPGVYIVREGDTLSEIVEVHYGTSRRLPRVLRANRGRIGDPDYIRPCQRIRLP